VVDIGLDVQGTDAVVPPLFPDELGRGGESLGGDSHHRAEVRTLVCLQFNLVLHRDHPGGRMPRRLV
jgi:hypothetical protein